MGNIDKDDRYWQGEIEISVEITSYHSRQRDYTLAAMSTGKQPSLKSSLYFKVEDDFENLVKKYNHSSSRFLGIHKQC